MADAKLSSATIGSRGTPNRATDLMYVVNGGTSYKSTINNELGISGNPVGDTDSQTLINKTLTAPTLTSPVLSGTVTGTYTFGGTPTFPSSVATLTGIQTLTNKTLTSPTINSPTITNASITQDAVVGFTTANSGTMYGIPITTAKLPGTSITNQTVGPNQLATGAANSTIVTTSETTASASYVDLATVTDTVTVTIGANGLALVLLYVATFNSAANANYISFAISGASTVAATDNFAIQFGGTSQVNVGAPFLVTGLTSGSTTFKMKYRTTSGTGTFLSRRISVIPL